MFKRLAEKRVGEALADTPVVVVQGPRQCGKTTLVRGFCGDGTPFVTLDDSLALDAAVRNPDGFIAQFPGRAVIDEVQRAPGLFRAIKKSVDADRRPGRFLLTGSSNVLTLPKLSESLAGRMEVVPLWPLAQSEVAGTEPFFLDDLLMGELPSDAEADGLWERVCAGGFPEPLGRASHDRREAWFSSYVTTVTERDVRDLADIEGLTAMPRLLRTLARHAGEPMNVSRLSRETGVPHTTLTRYASLLESVFLLRPLPSWKSGAKAAKLQFADPGVLTHLLGTSPEMLPQDEVAAQRSLECFVAAEVLRQCDARSARSRVQHFRSVRTWSVPVVVVAPDQRAVGIALSLDRSPGAEAFRGLEVLAEIAGADFAQGIVLHAGEEKRRVTEKLCMAPVSCLWG